MKKPYASALSQPLGIVLSTALLLILITACSGVTTSTGKTTATQQFPSDPIISTPVPEQAAQPGAVKVYVSLAEYTITSTVKVFHPGVHYYFIVTNRGHVVHEFMIMRDKPNGTPISLDEDYSDMLIHIETVFPGITLRMNYMFLPSLAGKYEIACLMRGHYAAGMRLPIVVAG